MSENLRTFLSEISTFIENNKGLVMFSIDYNNVRASTTNEHHWKEIGWSELEDVEALRRILEEK